jgi:hypothetical protein
MDIQYLWPVTVPHVYAFGPAGLIAVVYQQLQQVPGTGRVTHAWVKRAEQILVIPDIEQYERVELLRALATELSIDIHVQ